MEVPLKKNEREVTFENVNNLTPIQEFYYGQSIFITGGTGFMGKLLIEKLLRACPGINCIYLLIRSKKGKNVLQRKKELIEGLLFSTLREKEPTFQNRIVAIEGDCSLPNLGISMTDKTTLIQNISIVFHVAATVRFNEKIKSATAINVQSLKDAINLSKEMPKLKHVEEIPQLHRLLRQNLLSSAQEHTFSSSKINLRLHRLCSFVHVSTAYVNCLNNPINEKFYDPPIDPDKLIDLMECLDEKLLDDITPQLLGIWPNTYIYTKSVAENVVKKYAGSVPIGIFRPGVVISTYEEPIRGWIDNLYGPIGITAGASIGLIRIAYCNGSRKMNILPGDLTVNGLIVSAWEIANNRRRNEDIPIYNYVSKDNPITFDELKYMTVKYGMPLPSKEAIWYYSFRTVKYRLVYILCIYFLHLLPAFLIDTFALCIGKQPRLLKIYDKIHKMSDMLAYFTTTEWKYTNERWNELLNKLTIEDRELFLCDMKEINWNNFFKSYFLGVRIYILKDPIDTLPQARIKWRRLYWMHQSLKVIITMVFFMIMWIMVTRLFVTIDNA